MFKRIALKVCLVFTILVIGTTVRAENWETALQGIKLNENSISSVHVEKQLQSFSNSILGVTDPIETERGDREAADIKLSEDIDKNTQAIETERGDREAADIKLSEDIDKNTQAIETERGDREAADIKLSEDIDKNTQAIGNHKAIDSLNKEINEDSKTSISDGLTAAGNAIGDLNFQNTKYIPSDTKDLSTAVRSLDANLARANYRIDELDDKVEKHHKEMKRGFASLAAMTRLVPNARSKCDTQLSLGVGHYRGTTGIAIGAFRYVDSNTLVNAGIGYAGHGSATFGAGITFGF